MSVQTEIHDGVAVLTLDNPPVNGLGLETRRGLIEALQQAQQEAMVHAIVVTGGADIREFNTQLAGGSLNGRPAYRRAPI